MCEAEAAVRSALAAAGIAPHPEEIRQLVERYPMLREIMTRMDEVLDASEAFPELVFDVRTP